MTYKNINLNLSPAHLWPDQPQPLLTYGLTGPSWPTDVEGNGPHHGDKTAVKQAHDTAEDQKGLHTHTQAVQT